MVCPPGVNTLRKRMYLAHYLCVLLEWHHHLSQLPSSVGALPSESLCINSQGQSEGGTMRWFEPVLKAQRRALTVNIWWSHWNVYYLWPCLKARFLSPLKELVCIDKAYGNSWLLADFCFLLSSFFFSFDSGPQNPKGSSPSLDL